MCSVSEEYWKLGEKIITSDDYFNSTKVANQILAKVAKFACAKQIFKSKEVIANLRCEKLILIFTKLDKAMCKSVHRLISRKLKVLLQMSSH